MRAPMFTSLSDPPLALALVVFLVLVLACGAWVLAALYTALEAPPATRRASGTARRPLGPPASMRARMKARLTCLRVGHDDLYTFRFGRPAYRCQLCGQWRKHQAVVHYPREFRA